MNPPDGMHPELARLLQEAKDFGRAMTIEVERFGGDAAQQRIQSVHSQQSTSTIPDQIGEIWWRIHGAADDDFARGNSTQARAIEQEISDIYARHSGQK